MALAPRRSVPGARSTAPNTPRLRRTSAPGASPPSAAPARRVSASVATAVKEASPTHDANFVIAEKLALPAAAPPPPPAAPAWFDVALPANVKVAKTADDLVKILRKANRVGRQRLVVLEFITKHCYACRSLFPKVLKLAATEFQECVFVKVVASEEDCQLAETLGVDSFPRFALYKGEKRCEFSGSLSAAGLERLRRELRAHSSPEMSWTPGQLGPACLLHAPGWP